MVSVDRVQESHAKSAPSEQFADANTARKCSHSVKYFKYELPAPSRDCYRPRPEAGQRKAGAIFRGGGLAAARALDRLFAETHDPDQALET